MPKCPKDTYEQNEDGASQKPAPGMTRGRFLANSGGAIVGFSSLASVLAACGGSGGSTSSTPSATGKPPANPTGTLRIGQATPSTLDPTLGGGWAEFYAREPICDALTMFDYDGTTLRPRLATSWHTEDGREWTIRLRPRVKFQDGEPFDSSAVKRTFEYYTRPDAYYGSFVGPFTEFDDSDPLTARIIYKEPFPDLARNQPSLISMLSPKQIPNPRVDSRAVAAGPIGAGPYQFVKYNGGTLLLEANPTYWGVPPHYAEVEYKFIDDPQAQVSALLAGDIDLILQQEATDGEVIDDGPDTHTAEEKSITVFTLELLTSNAPFDDERVRQAAAFAVNKDLLLEKLFLGKGIVADSPMPPGAYGYAVPKTTYPYDPDQAKRLLQEAGNPSPSFELGTSPANRRIAEACASMFQEVGFSVQVRVLEPALLDKEEYNPDRSIQMTLGQPAYSNAGPLFISGGYTSEITQYKGRDLADSIDTMNTTGDGPRREAAIAESQEIIVGKVLEIPLVHPYLISGVSDTVQGYRQTGSGFLLLDGVYPAS
jgi:ABC-type transport system substrate-binding protein